MDKLKNVSKVVQLKLEVFRIVCADGFSIAHTHRRFAKVKCVGDKVQGKTPRCVKTRGRLGGKKKHSR